MTGVRNSQHAISLLAVALTAGLAGCARDYCGGKTHPWFSYPEAGKRSGFTQLHHSHFWVLDDRTQSEAIERLANHVAVEVTDEKEVQWFLPVVPFEPNLGIRDDNGSACRTRYPRDGVRAFLVRGVVTLLAIECSVWIKDEGKEVWVYQTSNDTFYSPFCQRQDPSPVIVFLRQKPDRVFATQAETPDGRYGRHAPNRE